MILESWIDSRNNWVSLKLVGDSSCFCLWLWITEFSRLLQCLCFVLNSSRGVHCSLKCPLFEKIYAFWSWWSCMTRAWVCFIGAILLVSQTFCYLGFIIWAFRRLPDQFCFSLFFLLLTCFTCLDLSLRVCKVLQLMLRDLTSILLCARLKFPELQQDSLSINRLRRVTLRSLWGLSVVQPFVGALRRS